MCVCVWVGGWVGGWVGVCWCEYTYVCMRAHVISYQCVCILAHSCRQYIICVVFAGVECDLLHEYKKL